MTRLLKVLSALVVAAGLMLGGLVAAYGSLSGPGAGPGPGATVGAGASGVPGVPVVPAVPAAASSLTGSVRAAVAADTSDFTFSLYAGEYFLDRDEAGHSTLRTVETFVAEFPDFDQNRGIIRAIPNDYDGVPLRTTVESVTDAQGAPVYFDTEVTDGFTELALGTDEFVRGSQTYVITYTQQNVVRAFEDTANDEFYWDTNGTGFDQPFGTVAARVHVDPSIVPFLSGSSACYTGAQGESGACQIVQETDPDAPAPDAAAPDAAAEAGQMFTAAAADLGPGENLTVAIGFTAGTFVQVPAEEQPTSTSLLGQAGVVGFPVVLLCVALIGAVYLLARRFIGPREPKGRGTIIAQYSLPKGHNLLEAADLINRPRSAMAAQIVSFAVRGNVRILDYPVTDGGGDFTLQLLRTDGVDDQELAVLATLFPDLTIGGVCELGVTNDALAGALAAATADARTRNIARGWRARPALTPARRWLLAGLGALVVGIVALLLFGNLPPQWWFPLVAVISAAALVAVTAARRPLLLSAAGVDRRDYLTGMKVYLDLAEADRFRMLQSPDGALRVTVPEAVDADPRPHADPRPGASAPDTVELVKLYEKLLPYAVLWGVEKEWAAELAVYYDQTTTTPDWFLTQNAFSGVYLASALGGMVNSVHTTETPTPPPSTWSGSGGGSFSGGSFGGGFSGGGGGGGGGGGR